MRAANTYQLDELLLCLEDVERPYQITERCFIFSKSVVRYVAHSKHERIYFSIFDQLLRSATSIGANVVEGKAGSSRKDWIKYMCIALKSSNEALYWIRLISEAIDVDNKDLLSIKKEATEISKIIGKILVNAQQL